ncbi:TOMM precursor leader peptide-binding protein [Massilia antarctica]|uniref:TOMM leader peptide-binding protein n=1 Tax=Massilia antarctica TaxID=2765360 RepID=A0AA48WC14_9BURK|nr:TOMM precursor leader peptide-binding protein [Massilia antarctica]QPI48764.1 TOMM precursor leader peptide-binding protein [Massilia antarctica]
MLDIASSTLKLRRDAIYMKTETGIIFRTGRGTFSLNSLSIYATFQQLLPHLTGKSTGAVLLGSVREESRRGLSDLLRVLIKNGVVQQLDSADALLVDPVISQAFAPQIEFIAHYGEQSHQRFLEFRNSNILLEGAGLAFISAGVALLRNGLSVLHVRTAPDQDLSLLNKECERSSERGVSCELVVHADGAPYGDDGIGLMLYCAENPDLHRVQELNREAHTLGYHFLPAMIHAGASIIGPIVAPHRPGCWQCAMLRWSDNATADTSSAFWKQLALRRVEPASAAHIPEVCAQILGNSMAMEAFKFFIGQPAPETHLQLLYQELSTLESTVKPILPHADCPVCWPEPAAQAAEPAAPLTGSDCLLKWNTLLDERFGVFRGFDDECLEQLPLRINMLDFCIGTAEKSGGGVLGWSFENNDGARLHAIRKAVCVQAAVAFPFHLQRALIARPDRHPDPVPAYAARQIVGWLGTASDEDLAQGYLAATDLESGAPVLVAAGAVHPQLDTDGCFNTHSGALGSGLDRQGAIEQAVLSLYEHVVLASLAHGTLALKRWNGSRSVPDKTTDYLLAASEKLSMKGPHIGIGSPGHGMFAAVALPGADPHCRVDELLIATGFSVQEAVNGLLAERLAQEQSARCGRAVRQSRRAGIHSNAEISLVIDGDTGLPAPDADAGMPQLLAGLAQENKHLLWRDVTSPDIALTHTLTVVKVVLAAGEPGEPRQIM